MKLYFDSSSLIKYFQNEKGSKQVSELIESHSNEVYISELSKVEIMSSIYRRCRNNKIDKTKLPGVIKSIEKIIANYHIEPLNSTVINETEDILDNIGKDIFLRSLDAIHLATFQLISDEDWKFVSNDNTLNNAAESLGYNILIPGD